MYYHSRLVIPNALSWFPYLLAEFHSTPLGGHSSYYRTYRRLAEKLYWIGMKNKVQEYVKCCGVCQMQKYLAMSPAGLLQPLNVPDLIWEDISMIVGLPKSKGYKQS